MIICSDWHIHSEASYDASLPLQRFKHEYIVNIIRRETGVVHSFAGKEESKSEKTNFKNAMDKAHFPY